MSRWTVLVTGLLAGGASCAAVQGGLLAGLVARHRHPATTAVSGGTHRKRARDEVGASPAARPPGEDGLPIAMFLAGRLVSHVMLGAALGLLGDVVQPEPRTGP
ncbi:MAG: hypothetical protein ACRD1K_18015 [Acidimicrobiales bacterium]